MNLSLSKKIFSFTLFLKKGRPSSTHLMCDQFFIMRLLFTVFVEQSIIAQSQSGMIFFTIQTFDYGKTIWFYYGKLVYKTKSDALNAGKVCGDGVVAVIGKQIHAPKILMTDHLICLAPISYKFLQVPA